MEHSMVQQGDSTVETMRHSITNSNVHASEICSIACIESKHLTSHDQLRQEAVPDKHGKFLYDVLIVTASPDGTLVLWGIGYVGVEHGAEAIGEQKRAPLTPLRKLAFSGSATRVCFALGSIVAHMGSIAVCIQWPLPALANMPDAVTGELSRHFPGEEIAFQWRKLWNRAENERYGLRPSGGLYEKTEQEEKQQHEQSQTQKQKQKQQQVDTDDPWTALNPWVDDLGIETHDGKARVKLDLGFTVMADRGESDGGMWRSASAPSTLHVVDLKEMPGAPPEKREQKQVDVVEDHKRGQIAGEEEPEQHRTDMTDEKEQKQEDMADDDSLKKRKKKKKEEEEDTTMKTEREGKPVLQWYSEILQHTHADSTLSLPRMERGVSRGSGMAAAKNSRVRREASALAPIVRPPAIRVERSEAILPSVSHPGRKARPRSANAAAGRALTSLLIQRPILQPKMTVTTLRPLDFGLTKGFGWQQHSSADVLSDVLVEAQARTVCMKMKMKMKRKLKMKLTPL